jgi:hypothetical protein
MGMFKDLRATTKAAKEISKDFDPQALRDRSKERMAGLNDMMKAQTAALTSVTQDGMPATASVVSVGASSGSVNMQPMIPVELLIMSPGQPPRPYATTLIVPVTSVGRLQAGATLAVTVSASNPDAVVINW